MTSEAPPQEFSIEQRLNYLIERCHFLPRIDIPVGSVRDTATEALAEIDKLMFKLKSAQAALEESAGNQLNLWSRVIELGKEIEKLTGIKIKELEI